MKSIGVGIPREQALRLSRRILADAERERSELVAREAQFDETISVVRKLAEGEDATKLRKLARLARAAIVRQLYEAGSLSEEQAVEVLTGPLTPGDETTIEDDRHLLKIGKDELLWILGGKEEEQ
jgi:hypothetical protein